MTELSARRFSDAELLDAELVITDGNQLDHATSSPPPPGLSPKIVAEYDLPSGADARRCCYCPSHTRHRKGFIVTFESPDLYLVGSHCGPKYLGLEFKVATGTHSKLKDRKSALVRLSQIAAIASELRNWCETLLFSEGWKALDAVARQFQAAAPDAFIRLRAIVNTSGQLIEDVQVRDFAAEALRKDSGDETKNLPPIFRTESVVIAPLRGRGFLMTEDIRSSVYALKIQAAEVTSVASKPTDGFMVGKLTNLAVEFDRKRKAVLEGIERLQRAHLFLSPDHIEALVRWAEGGTSNRLRVEDGRLVLDGKGGPTVLAAPPALIVPPPPSAG